jgi:beta-lactamase superfamily II metal-dependent hydrolase
LVAIVAGYLYGSTSASGVLTAHFIDVGQGDSCWLHLPNGDDVLVDAGKRQAGPTVVAYLQQHGVADIELMVASHGDADHIGGLLDVLASMPVQAAWLDSQTCTTQTCDDFYQALALNGVVTETVRMGESYEWGQVTALVLNPSEPLYVSKNENSIVLRVSHGSVDVLLTGDAETGAEGRMLNSGLPLAAEILKVSHHGSSSASSAQFLSAVAPQEAIISVGPNPWGHPRAEVLERLANVGANIWRTDQLGTVVVTIDGTTYTVVPASEPTATATVTPSYEAFLPVIMRRMRLVEPAPSATPTGTHTATPTLTRTGTVTQTPTPTLSPTITPTRTPVVNTLSITALQYSAPDEYVEVTNHGPAAQDVTDWKIQSVVGDQWYTFPASYTLAAGSWVRVHSGPDALDNPPAHLRWSGAYIWSNDGDEARLFDDEGLERGRWRY